MSGFEGLNLLSIAWTFLFCGDKTPFNLWCAYTPFVDHLLSARPLADIQVVLSGYDDQRVVDTQPDYGYDMNQNKVTA